ncbi:MAG: BPSL0067 family protein [Pseudomonadota bacterium]
MSFIATDPKKFLGQSIGSGQCVAFVQQATAAGITRTWKRGDPVRKANLPIGTAIATFDENGRYANDTHGKSHAAIYMGQDAKGIQVLDQWVATHRNSDGSVTKKAVPVHARTLAFNARPVPVDDGRNYYVVE